MNFPGTKSLSGQRDKTLLTTPLAGALKMFSRSKAVFGEGTRDSNNEKRKQTQVDLRWFYWFVCSIDYTRLCICIYICMLYISLLK